MNIQDMKPSMIHHNVTTTGICAECASKKEVR